MPWLTLSFTLCQVAKQQLAKPRQQAIAVLVQACENFSQALDLVLPTLCLSTGILGTLARGSHKQPTSLS